MPSLVRGWLAVLAVAWGIFTLMTSELLPVGLIPGVAGTLDVSTGTAGLMLTAPGLVAAVSAPVIAVLGARIDRRLLLGVLIGLVGGANLVSAIAPHFAVIVAARLLVGVGVGGFWAIAGGLALRLVPNRQVGAATTVIFGGVAAASVLGVPFGTVIGDLSGWRTAFAVVGMVGLVALVCLVLALPPLPSAGAFRFADLARLARDNTAVRVGVALTFLLITGQFTAYTFVRPILQEVSGIGPGLIGPLLLGYGVAGLAGNAVAGTLAARNVYRTLLMIGTGLTAVMVLIATIGGDQVRGSLLLLGWGLAYGGVSVSLQNWMLRAAPRATEAATSLFVAAFNLSIALGAALGAVALDRIATASTLWVGGGLCLLTVLTLAATRRS